MVELEKASTLISANAKTIPASFSLFLDKLGLGRAWIDRYWDESKGNPAHVLLVGAKASAFEAGVSWGAGLHRAAAASLRTYVENVFAYLYYKDHPVEFGVMSRRHDDLTLPKAVISYLCRVDIHYKKASDALYKKATRGNDYFYSDLSEYLHAHPSFLKPGLDVVDLVVSNPPDASFLTLVGQVDEFVSDYYATYNRSQWAVIPVVVQHNLSARLGKALPSFLTT